MKPIIPQIFARLVWDERMFEVIESFGLTRSDAQGICEVDQVSDLLDAAFARGDAPETAAREAFQSGVAT